LSIEDILDNIHSKKLNANQGKIQDAVHANTSQSPMSIPGMELTSASIIPAEIRVFQGRICYIKDKSQFKAESSSISGSRAGTELKSRSSR
jgi:hypothetical protein